MPESATLRLAAIARASASASSCVRQPVRPPGTPSSSSASSCAAAASVARRRLRSPRAAPASRPGNGTRDPGARRSSADHRAHLERAEQLVGHQDAAHAEAHADAELLHVGERDAPGAGGELLREDLRRHRRLAVRRQQHAGRGGEVAHPGVVVRQRRIADHGQRQRQVAGEHVPALRADGARAAAARPTADSPWSSSR